MHHTSITFISSLQADFLLLLLLKIEASHESKFNNIDLILKFIYRIGRVQRSHKENCVQKSALAFMRDEHLLLFEKEAEDNHKQRRLQSH
jgi:hypothetical protein